MLAALVLAACLAPPMFGQADALPACVTPDDPGPCLRACAPADQATECRCSEHLEWEPVATAEWYEILRRNPDGTTQNVGSTRSASRATYLDEDGNAFDAYRPTRWEFVRDIEVPHAGTLYQYQVRACRAARPPEVADPCGAWTSEAVAYPGAPYACYSDGAEVPCYPGDPLASAPIPDPDRDLDGVPDASDNCLDVANADQRDTNGNGIGDACEPIEAEVYISEVLYDQVSGGKEFVELHAPRAAVDVTGWTLSDQDTLNYTIGAPGTSCGSARIVIPAGGRLTLWSHTGTAICSGASLAVYMSTSAILERDGDDLVLRDASGACRDYLAYETGPLIDAAPAGCAWAGPNPTNGNVAGVSIVRQDTPGTIDTNSGGDWSQAGSSSTVGPASPQAPNSLGAP